MNDDSLICADNEWPLELRHGIANAMFNNTSEGVCVTNIHDLIVEVNPTLCILTGYSRSELVGSTPKIFSSGFQSPKMYAALHTSLAAIGQWGGELWNRHKTGRLYACRVNISAIRNGQGAITHYLSIQADITSAKLYQERLEKSANYDGLTGLPNRNLLMDRLHQAMAQAQRTSLMLAICYLDLDGFKAINDEHGHEAGDQALIEVAKRMNSAVRAGDTVARVGGDEFVILLWGLKDAQEFGQTLDRLVTSISALTLLGGLEVKLAVSVGVTLFPEDGTDTAVLLAQADSAMYRSKILGGGCWGYFSP